MRRVSDETLSRVEAIASEIQVAAEDVPEREWEVESFMGEHDREVLWVREKVGHGRIARMFTPRRAQRESARLMALLDPVLALKVARIVSALSARVRSLQAEVERLETEVEKAESARIAASYERA